MKVFHEKQAVPEELKWALPDMALVLVLYCLCIAVCTASASILSPDHKDIGRCMNLPYRLTLTIDYRTEYGLLCGYAGAAWHV